MDIDEAKKIAEPAVDCIVLILFNERSEIIPVILDAHVL